MVLKTDGSELTEKNPNGLQNSNEGIKSGTLLSPVISKHISIKKMEEAITTKSW